MQSKLVEPKNKNMELKPGIRSPATSFCRHLLRRSSNSHPIQKKKKKKRNPEIYKTKANKKKYTSWGLPNEPKSNSDRGRLFPKFFFPLSCSFVHQTLQKKKGWGGKEKHNKLLSWIKREQQYTLCQSWIKKKEREWGRTTLLLLSK